MCVLALEEEIMSLFWVFFFVILKDEEKKKSILYPTSWS